MRDIFPVPGLPLLELLTVEGRIGILSDLHLGTSKEWRKNGIRISNQYEWDHLIEAISKEGFSKLVLLGDIKASNFSFNSWEKMDVLRFLSRLKIPVEIVRGNHDAGAHELSEKKIKVFDELIVKKKLSSGRIAGLAHGHILPKEEIKGIDVLVMGHFHPCINLTDEVGGRWILKSWLFGEIHRGPKKIKVIIMPAGNPLIRGLPVNESKKMLSELKFKIGKMSYSLASFEALTLELELLGRVGQLVLEEA